MRSRLATDRLSRRPGQMRLPLGPAGGGFVPEHEAREAGRRGLALDESLEARDRRLVGEIGGLIAGLNAALDAAAEAGVDAAVTVHYQTLPDGPIGSPSPGGRRRCILRGALRRLALDARV